MSRNDSSPSWGGLLARPGADAHIACVSGDAGFLAEAAAGYVGAGLLAEEGVLVLATHGRWKAMAARLGSALEGTEGRLVYADAARALDRLMAGDRPDPARFEAFLDDALARIEPGRPGLRAYGELVDVLRDRGNWPAAVALEGLWDAARRRRPFALLCSYGLDPLDPRAYGGPLEAVRATHACLIPARDSGRLDEAVDLALEEVLGRSLSASVRESASSGLPSVRMPRGQAALLALSRELPHTSARVLSLARAIYRGGGRDG